MSLSVQHAWPVAIACGGLGLLLAVSLLRSRFRADRLFCCVFAFNLAVLAALGAGRVPEPAGPWRAWNPRDQPSYFAIAMVPKGEDTPEAVRDPGTVAASPGGVAADTPHVGNTPPAGNEAPPPSPVSLPAPVGEEAVRLPAAGGGNLAVGDAAALPNAVPRDEPLGGGLPVSLSGAPESPFTGLMGFPGPATGYFAAVVETPAIFLIDISASMSAHERLPKVLRKLNEILDGLPDGSEYQIFCFANGLERWLGGGDKPTWQVRKNGESLKQWLNQLKADGATTEPLPALLAALQMSPLPKAIHLLTDGEFTYGPEQEAELDRANPGKIVIHGTLIGEAKTAPADSTVHRIARRFGGEPLYVSD